MKALKHTDHFRERERGRVRLAEGGWAMGVGGWHEQRRTQFASFAAEWRMC